MKRIFLVIILFYGLAVFETSFLGHFHVFGGLPNLLLIGVLMLNLFEKPEEKSGVWAAVVGGFFWDVFSPDYIGFHLLILLAISLAIKHVFKRYLRIPDYI